MEKETYYVIAWDMQAIQKHENTDFDEMAEKYPNAFYIAGKSTMSKLKKQLNMFEEL